jgi:hypothetical protein
MELARDGGREVAAAACASASFLEAEFQPDDRLTALPIADDKPFIEPWLACGSDRNRDAFRHSWRLRD